MADDMTKTKWHFYTAVFLFYFILLFVGKMINEGLCDGRVFKATFPVKTRRNHWAGDVSLVGAGVGSKPTRNQVFLITFNLSKILYIVAKSNKMISA